MKRNQLTAHFVRKIDRPGRYHDGWGLMLLVTPTGGKSWVQRLTIRGKRRDLGLGSLDFTSLAEARAKAFDNRRIARAGGDPTATAKAAIPIFADALDAVIAIHREGWKHAGKSEAQWRASLRDYAMPRIGRRQVDKITSADVLAILTPHWHTKHETMRRVRQRISAVMQWAIAEGHRSDDPAGDAIRAALPRNGAVKRHQRALHYSSVAGALAAVSASGASRTVALALEFLVLTAARSGEARSATWDEIDLAAAVWTVPAGKMKAKREHRVPLSDRALAILHEADRYRDRTGLLFPSQRGKVIADNTVSKLLRDLGIDGTPHGMRSAFRDWAAERSGLPERLAEHALAHTSGNKVEAAYRRTDQFEQRRGLMERWAAYLDRDTAAKVVSIRG